MITQSPMGRSNPLVIAARHDKSHLDLATHFIRDSNALPDKSVYNPSGYLERSVQAMTPPPPTTTCGRHSSIEPRRSSSLRPDTSSLATVSQLSQSRPPSAKNPATHWPPVFYADFTSRTWLTIANSQSISSDSGFDPFRFRTRFRSRIPENDNRQDTGTRSHSWTLLLSVFDLPSVNATIVVSDRVTFVTAALTVLWDTISIRRATRPPHRDDNRAPSAWHAPIVAAGMSAKQFVLNLTREKNDAS